MEINNIIDFQNIWNQTCSKYNLDNNLISYYPPQERIIVIGDLHGSYDMMISSLKLATLIDNNDNWIGNNTYVVIVGDQIDNCRSNSFISCNKKGVLKNDQGNDWKILKYLTILHNKALYKGGRVISLLGNHELMNVDGNLDYVSYESIKEFGTKENRINLFKPGNDIANFLACTRQVVVMIGSNLFSHAGIVSEIANKYSLKSINQIMTLFLLNKLNNGLIYDELHKTYHKINKDTFDHLFYDLHTSPLWNRVYGYMGQDNENNINNLNNTTCNKNLDILKEIYQVDKIFVGHTPMLKKGISSICDGKVWLTDYGAADVFNTFKIKSHLHQAQILEILQDGQIINILKNSLSKQSQYYKETN